jgi:hypothetical protein
MKVLPIPASEPSRPQLPISRGLGLAGPVARPNWLRRLAIFSAILLVGGYVLGVTSGYLWLRYGRQFEKVRIAQVALFRLREIRQAIAAQQFVQAKAEWDAKNIQSAYVYYVSAVRRDPDNKEGRLAAARFLAAMGAANLELALLEEGLARAPDDADLNRALFGVLLATGRDRHVLDLLHGSFAAGLSGPNAAFLQKCELQATLGTNGGPAAKLLLDRHPGLKSDPTAAGLVAKVLWEAAERPQAIQMLAALVQAHPDAFSEYFQLAVWQQAAGMESEALQTALKASQQFPKEPATRILVLDIFSSRTFGTQEWRTQVALYLRDFADRPDAVLRLAELAGRKGWVDLARTLYELGAERQADLGLFALCYADALGNHQKLSELRAVLAEVDAQCSAAGTGFLVQLRERQIVAAQMAGEPENVREYARRLATLVRAEPDLLERYRGRYLKQGMPEAAAQFTVAAAKPKVASK